MGLFVVSLSGFFCKPLNFCKLNGLISLNLKPCILLFTALGKPYQVLGYLVGIMLNLELTKIIHDSLFFLEVYQHKMVDAKL